MLPRLTELARALVLAALCVGVQSNGEYENGSEVVLYANKVRPCEEASRLCLRGSLTLQCRMRAGGPVCKPQRGVRFLQSALLRTY